MNDLYRISNIPSSEKDANWYKTAAVVLTPIIGALALYKDLGSLTGYILLAIFLVLLFPSGQRMISRFKLNRKKKKFVASFSNDLGALIAETAKFLRSNNEYSIPYFLRGIGNGNAISSIRPSGYIEDHYVSLINSLDRKCKRGVSTYMDFEDISNDLHECLLSFTRIYVDEFGSKLQNPHNIEILNIEQKSQLSDRFQLFKNHLQSYNLHREKISSYWKKDETNRLAIPTIIIK